MPVHGVKLLARRVACLLGVGALVAVGLAACRTAGKVTTATADPQGCAECHTEIHTEWAGSRHARAWTSLRFKKQTADYTLKACLGCHAPGSLFETQGRPKLRDQRRPHGVDCQACHLHQGTLVGPHGPGDRMIEAHPTRKKAVLYRSSELCGRCHEKAYAEVQAYSRNETKIVQTCQECHMPPVWRTITQAKGVGAPVAGRKVKQRRHTFRLSAMPAPGRAVKLTLETRRTPKGVKVEVSLLNRIYHRIPTGKSGLAVIRLLVTGWDAGGKPAGRFVERFKAADDTALVPKVKKVVSGSLPANAVRLELRLERETPEGKGGLLLHERKAELK